MIQTGDMIFYPLQGAGIVKALEIHSFGGQRKKYYKVSFPMNKMNILIPEDKASVLGIRPLSTPDYLDRTRARFFEKNNSLPGLFRQRYNAL